MKWSVSGELVHLKKIVLKYQIIKGIIPTLSENFKQIRQTWPQLQPQSWSISNFFCKSTKWKKVSSPHYLKISIRLSKRGLSYSLKHDGRSISKITFFPIWELTLLIQSFEKFSKKTLMVNIQICNILAWMRSVWWIC